MLSTDLKHKSWRTAMVGGQLWRTTLDHTWLEDSYVPCRLSGGVWYACIHCNITKPSKGGAGLLLMKAELFGDLVDTMFISGPTQHLQVFLLNY